jgi:hypothetical protein
MSLARAWHQRGFFAVEKRESSFWASLPGILTALGTLAAATGGLIALFVGTSAGRHSPALVTSTVTAVASPSGSQAGGTTGGTGGTTGGGGGTTNGTGGTNVSTGGGGTRHHHGGGGGHPTTTPTACPTSGTGGGTGCTSNGPAQLAAPLQASPADGTLLTNYPRYTDLTWQATAGAASYLVEIQCLDCAAIGQWSSWQSATTTGTNYPFTWVGDNYGRWRVTAIGADGSQGTPSGWWQFDYRTQAVG